MRMSESNVALSSAPPNRRHAWYAAIIVAVGMAAVFVLALAFSYYVTGSIVSPASVVLLLPVVGWILGFVLMARGDFEPGIHIALILMALAAPMTSFWVAGRGLVLGIGIGFAILFVATLALPPARAQWFIVLGVIAGLSTVVADVFGAPGRPTLLLPTLPGILLTFALLIALAVFVLINFKSYTLRIKLLLAFVLLALVSVGGVTFIASEAIRASLTENAARDLQTRAQAAAAAIGITMDRNVDRLITLSLDDRLRNEVASASDSYPADNAARAEMVQKNAAQWATESPQEPVVRNALNGPLANSLRQLALVFQGNQQILITDASGSVFAATEWLPEYNYANAAWWKNAFNDGRGALYIGEPEFDTRLGAYGIPIAVPIYAPGRERAVGVLHSMFALTALERALMLNSFGASGKIDLLFPQGLVLTPEGNFKNLSADDLAQLQAAYNQTLPTVNYRGEPRVASQGIVGVSDEQPEPYLRSRAWRTIATIDPQEALTLVEAGTRAALFAGILAIVMAILAALGLAQLLTRPILRLSDAAAQIQGGDYNARAPVESTDEIGALAVNFNSMTQKLQDTLEGLSQRVEERTLALQQLNDDLTANAGYLSALSDVSAGLFARQNLNELLSLTVERAGALMSTQHGFVFFQDPAEHDIVMRVGVGVYDDLIGTHAQRGVGLAGMVWQTGKTMVIDNYQTWEGRLPGTRRDALRAIVAVPLKRGAGVGNADDETIGVIGLAYTEQGRTFHSNQVGIMERFAQLASLALDNAQLYNSSEARVRELAALNSISQIVAKEKDLEPLAEQVGTEIAQIFATDIAYVAYSDAETRTIEFPFVMDNGARVELAPVPFGTGLTWQVIETGQPLLRNAMTEQEYARMGAVETGEGEAPSSLLSVPLTAGAHVVGMMSVQRAGAGHGFTPRDCDLMSTIATTVGVGIENARLAQATEHRLQELSALNRVSMILTSTDLLDARLAKVGRELHNIFRVSSVYIALYDAATNVIHMPFFMGEGQEFPIEPYTLGPGFTSHVLSTRAPLLINKDMAEQMRSLQALNAGDGEMNESYLGVPIALGDQLLGVIGLSDLPKNRFTASDLELLLTIASAVGASIQNAQLFAQTQDALAEAQRLAENARADGARIDALNRRLTREGWQKYLEAAAGELMYETAQSSLADTAAGTNGHGTDDTNGKKVAVPIVLRGETIGTIELDYDNPDAEWSTERQEIVSDVGETLGLVLDNARLFNESQRRVGELDALNRISQAVSTELDLESLLTTVGEQVRLIFDVENIYIALYDKQTQIITLPYFVNDNKRVQIEPIRFGEGLTSEIIRNRAPLLINKDTDVAGARLGAKVYGNRALSYLGVPILIGDDVIGVLSIQSTAHEGMFTQDNVHLLETICANLGTAIQSTQLYGAMEQEVQVRQRAEEEIKLSLKEKEILLKEIHHRVKNNLQIITSLLNLQSAQIKDAETLSMFRESQARVRSMALIHEKLYQSRDLARIDFDGYVRDLMIYLFRSYAANPDQIRTEIDTPNIYLGIDTAIPCGLIINELVTNTMKYAFPGGQRGHLYVGLHQHDDGNLTLKVVDDGIGFPESFDWRESDSLGLQLVSTLTSQLHGKMQVDGSHGASFLLTFPAQ